MNIKFMTLEYFKADDGMPGTVRATYDQLVGGSQVVVTIYDGDGASEEIRAKVQWAHQGSIALTFAEPIEVAS